MGTRIVRESKHSTWDVPQDTNDRTKFTRAMAFAKEIGLSDDMRYELARMIPGVDKDDGGSWKKLDGKQLHDLNCMLDGYVWITHLKSLTEHDYKE